MLDTKSSEIGLGFQHLPAISGKSFQQGFLMGIPVGIESIRLQPFWWVGFPKNLVSLNGIFTHRHGGIEPSRRALSLG